MKLRETLAGLVLMISSTMNASPGIETGLFVGTDLNGKTCSMEVAGDDGFWAKVNYTGNEEYPLYYNGKTGHSGADSYGLESENAVSKYSIQVDVDYGGKPLDVTFILDGVRNRCFFSE